VRSAGCRTFIVHARKAWLQGCRPRRTARCRRSTTTAVPRLKAAHPSLEIVLNGGIGSLEEARAHLAQSTAWRSAGPPTRTPICWPRSIGAVRRAAAGAVPPRRCLEAADPLCRAAPARRWAAQQRDPPLLGLYHGRPRARAFRRHLSERARREGRHRSAAEAIAHRRRRACACPGGGRMKGPEESRQTSGSAPTHSSSYGT
jgi:tRNA-dihydrouridine synthase A